MRYSKVRVKKVFVDRNYDGDVGRGYTADIADIPLPVAIRGCPMGRTRSEEPMAAVNDLISRVKSESGVDLEIDEIVVRDASYYRR